MDTATRVCCARLSLWMRILHACSGIITISACVLRIRDYYFSGELASFPLPWPHERSMEKNKLLIYKEKSEIDRLFRGDFFRENVWRSLETFCRNTLDDAFFIYNAVCAAITHKRGRHVSAKKKQKQEGKKKNMGEGFHFTPDEQTEPRGLFVSIPHAPSFNREISDKIIVILYLYEKSSGREETIRRLKLATHRIKI